MTLTVAEIGGYRILEVLGEGGMGRVYRARDPGLERDVAVKLLKGNLEETEEAKQRFLREARAAAKLHHPRVVSVFAVGEHEGIPYLVLELVDGEDLREVLKRDGPLAIETAIDTARDVAEALQAADEVGLVHRDVKPGNLIRDGARVKLMDFGLARPLDGSSDVTSTGIVVGTPSYVAPELARGKDATRHSDVYALGCTLYELLTGEHPFKGETVPQILMAQIQDPPPDIRAKRPEVPLRLAELIERMLAKDPKGRPQSYAELIDALDHATETSGPIEVNGSGPVKVSGRFSSIKSETRTVMFTDIVDYSARTGAQSREEAARWLEIHDALLRPVLKAFGGNLVKTIGDAFLVTFRSPTDAVLCGMAIQDRLALHNRDAPAEDRIRVRVSISSGEVRLHKGDVLGEPVNIASRLEKFAEPGDVILSDAVYATMNTAEVPTTGRGPQSLKGIAREVQVYAVQRVPRSDLPYGGRTLPTGLDKVDAATWLKGAAASAADSMARSTETAARRLGLPVAALAGLLALVVVGFLIGYLLSQSSELHRIDAGEAAQVLAELRGKVEPEDQLLRGHALVALDRRGDAVGAYRRAADGGARDERMMANLLGGLDNAKARASKKLLADWPGDPPDARLREMLQSDQWYRRQNAADVLESREVTFDQEAFGIRDLTGAKTCQGRLQGLRRLKKHGTSERALKAVKKASKRLPDNLCMLLEPGATEAAIRRRMKSK